MLRLACKIPNNSFVACSGGVDSMVVCDFLLRAKKKFSIVHIHHGTPHGNDAYKFVKQYALNNNISLLTKFIKPYSTTQKKVSSEAYWRDERYNIFHSLSQNVVTAHHLDDAVEWWIFSSMHGKSKLIPVTNKNVIRPLLVTEKAKILNWAKRHNVQHVQDPSNMLIKYKRNHIRHNIMPEILQINPGIRKVIKKKYL
tara:strand:- start:2244 stop:2837 length:594 start_codon:yes stop_codon:yes gene_type:complete